MTASHRIERVSVFAAGPGGGNPAPVMVDAVGLSDADMRAVAKTYGHESVFVLPPSDGSSDFTFRFFVPNHEMEMCGHATVGAVWLLNRLGRLPRDHVRIATLSGIVQGRITQVGIEISQPKGKLEDLPDADRSTANILSVLGIDEKALAPQPIRNASTSRVKTLIPLKSVAILDGLRPDFAKIEQICEAIGSTGLYPFAVCDAQSRTFDARQFPKSSGYPEDAATGIAAAALAFGLLENGQVTAEAPVRVRQGRAMGRASEIRVRFETGPARTVTGCWLGGDVRLEDMSGR
ncbi:MAG: PhzF family phenazine biosynthesis protein [Rhizomicrobium sp.]